MSTRRLVLIRHSKAAGGAPDVERPLAQQGMRDAAAIGRWLAHHGVAPDRAVVSPALRAAQTWQAAAARLGVAEPPNLDERIYDNDVDELLHLIRATPPEVRTLVLVGHNPSIRHLAAELDDAAGDAAARRALSEGYPTSGIAVFDVDGEWSELGRQAATLTAFAAPRG